MKMQIDCTKRGAGFLSEPVRPSRPLRFVTVSTQHAGLPGLFDLADPGTKLAKHIGSRRVLAASWIRLRHVQRC